MGNFKLGDYILFGSYLEEQILWQIINFDFDGDPLLFSHNILTFRAFDSKGDKHSDENRKISGSNNWENSNIRQWLNSKDDSICWIQNKPTHENLSIYSNDILIEAGSYSSDMGFLSNKNFTKNEYKLIKPCIRKVVLSEIDKINSEGIIENIESRIVRSLKGAEVKKDRHYKNIEDRAFLLSVRELNEWVVDKGFKYIKKPTSESIDLRLVKNKFYFNINKNMDYWLSTPYSSSSNMIYCACNVFVPIEAYHSLIGVVPAMYIKLNAINIISGNGDYESAYVLKDDSIVNGFHDNNFKEKDRLRKEILNQKKENTKKAIDSLSNIYLDYKKQTEELFLINQDNITTQLNETSQVCIKYFVEIISHVENINPYLIDSAIGKCLLDSRQIVNNSEADINAVYFTLDKDSTSYKDLLTIAHDSIMHNNHILFFAILRIINYKLNNKTEIESSDILSAKHLKEKLIKFDTNSRENRETLINNNILVNKTKEEICSPYNEVSRLNSVEVGRMVDESSINKPNNIQKPITKKGNVKPEFIWIFLILGGIGGYQQGFTYGIFISIFATFMFLLSFKEK